MGAEFIIAIGFMAGFIIIIGFIMGGIPNPVIGIFINPGFGICGIGIATGGVGA